MRIERRVIDTARSEWRFNSEDGTFAGYLNVHDVVDTYGTRFRPGSWISGGLDTAAIYPFLDMHDRSSVTRSVLGGFTASEDDKGLFISGRYLNTQAGQEAREAAAAGVAPELSVGFERVRSDEKNRNDIVAARLVEGSQIIKGFASTPGAELTEVRSVELARRMWPPMEGSYEEMREKLRLVVLAWASEQYGFGDDSGGWWTAVDATFPDSVVVTVENYDDGTSETWRIPYTVGADGQPELGDPEPVDVVSSVVARSAAPDTDTRRRLAIARLRLVGA